MNYRKLKLSSLFLLLFCFLSINFAFCQENIELKNENTEVKLKEKEGLPLDSLQNDKSTDKIIKNLNTLQISIAKLKKDREALQVKMQSTEGRGREDYFIDEIKNISDKIANLEEDYIELATGVKINKISDEESEKKDIVNELTELLKPLIGELKELTSRPRQIDYLKSQSSQLEDNVSLLEKGVNNLDEVIFESKSSDLKSSLSKLKANWENELSIKNTKLRVVNDKLTELVSNQKTVIETVSDVTNLFFKSRGRNLLFAIISAVLFWLLFSSWRKKLEFKWVNRGLSSKKRLIIIALDITSILGSLLVFLFILFAIGDWVLVVLTVLFVIGVVWALKHTIPRYWEQTILLLNIGPVREGDRVVYRGLPWKIKRLHFQSTLENPALSDGKIRLPIKDLLNMRSWSASSNEPWFPSKTGDWILIDDNTYGMVYAQSVEAVIIKLKGSSYKSYPTVNFLEAMPVNLSKGFRIKSTVGLDYELRKKAVTDIPTKLQEGIKRKLLNENIKNEDFKISVEFELMDSSSLNFAVIVDFNGVLAKDYQILKRLIQRLALEVCNEQKYSIPFPQMDVHLNDLNK